MELDRVRGMLFGVALGDALGLPFEGLPSHEIRGPLNRYRLFGRTGFVSDDTEQTALVAQALCGERNVEEIRARVRRSLIGWFLRLPFGIGGATLRACVRMLVGVSNSGVESAGNGAAMRAHPIAILADAEERHAVSHAVASLTHTDPRALDAARFVAEVTARALRTDDSPRAIVESLVDSLNGELHAAVSTALDGLDLEPEAAGLRLGNTGFVVCSLGICAWAFARASTPIEAIERAIRAGGDTDTHASIVGGWAGARFGISALPAARIGELQRGPFGPAHLEELARALHANTKPPTYVWPLALLRNLALYPVILAHGLRRLWP